MHTPKKWTIAGIFVQAEKAGTAARRLIPPPPAGLPGRGMAAAATVALSPLALKKNTHKMCHCTAHPRVCAKQEEELQQSWFSGKEYTQKVCHCVAHPRVCATQTEGVNEEEHQQSWFAREDKRIHTTCATALHTRGFVLP